MNTQVEEILKKHITTVNSFLDENGHNRFTECVEALTSLIQQEKERAVREFGGWWNNKYERERTMRGYFTEDIREIYPVDIEQYLAERKDV